MPRTIVYETNGIKVTEIKHSFTWEEFQDSVTSYFKYIFENKSLGTQKDGTPVEEEIFLLIGRSLKIIIPSFFLSLLLGVLKGIYDFRTRDRRRNFLGNRTTWVLQALPDFFIIVAFQFGVSLLIRMGMPKISIYGFTKWYHILLPIIFLTLFTSTYIARVTSSLLMEQVGNDYIRTAISKGVSQNRIIYKHMLANCWSKLLDYIPTFMLILLSHLIVVEFLTYYRGISNRFVESFVRELFLSYGAQIPINYPIIIATIIFFTILLLIADWIKIIGKVFFNPYAKGVAK